MLRAIGLKFQISNFRSQIAQKGSLGLSFYNFTLGTLNFGYLWLFV